MTRPPPRGVPASPSGRWPQAGGGLFEALRGTPCAMGGAECEAVADEAFTQRLQPHPKPSPRGGENDRFQAAGHDPRAQAASRCPTPQPGLPRRGGSFTLLRTARRRRFVGYERQPTSHPPLAAFPDSPDEAAPPPRSGGHAAQAAKVTSTQSCPSHATGYRPSRRQPYEPRTTNPWGGHTGTPLRSTMNYPTNWWTRRPAPTLPPRSSPPAVCAPDRGGRCRG